MNYNFNELYYKYSEEGYIRLLFFNIREEYSLVYEAGDVLKEKNSFVDLKEYFRVKELIRNNYEIIYLSGDYDCLYAIVNESIVIQLSYLSDGTSHQQLYFYDKKNNNMTPLGITEYEAAKKRANYYDKYDLNKL
ncbi:hypothetical protein [Chryseobacterium hispalense]|uniref:hypothetical protein n=1 Tax=Chryseobacterium hispalense TaxID=1453492 RepID=UPI00049323A3|nr:hypothetical protein [Chryseobacterium hispalense]